MFFSYTRLFHLKKSIINNVFFCGPASPVATTQDNLDDKLRKFEIRDMMGLTDDRDISETVSETWSTDVLGSDFDPNMDEDRLQEIAGEYVMIIVVLQYISIVLGEILPSSGVEM